MQIEVTPEESVSMAVLRGVSAVTGRDPTALPPLHETLDPDTLNRLCAPQADGASRSECRISFQYAGCHVDVVNNGHISISEAADTQVTE